MKNWRVTKNCKVKRAFPLSPQELRSGLHHLWLNNLWQRALVQWKAALPEQPGVLSWPRSWSLQLLSNSSLWQLLCSPNPSLGFCILFPLHSVGKSKRSLNLCLVLFWKAHTQQLCPGHKSLECCCVIPSTCRVEKTTKTRDETAWVIADRNWWRRVKIKSLGFFLILPCKLERSHISWYRGLKHQVEVTCTTLHQVQQFPEVPQYSHSHRECQCDSALCPIIITETHTKTRLKFYKLQMKKVSEKNAQFVE